MNWLSSDKENGTSFLHFFISSFLHGQNGIHDLCPAYPTHSLWMRMWHSGLFSSNRRPSFPKDNGEVQDDASPALLSPVPVPFSASAQLPLNPTSQHRVRRVGQPVSPVVPTESLEVSPVCVDWRTWVMCPYLSQSL